MKRAWLIPAACAALALYLTVTGFQCGSSEMTTAKLAYSQKNLDKADSSFMKEVEKNPANGEAWYFLGRVRLEKGNYTGMAEAYKQSLSVSKEFEPKIIEDKKYVWGITLNQGVNFFNRSQTLRKDPAAKDSADLYLQKSISAYKMALVVNPDSVITYQNMAVAQHLSGNYDDEIATLQKALSIRKDPPLAASLINAYIQKAEESKKNGKTAEAAEGFNQAITALTEQRAANPGDDEMMGTLINLYIEAGRTKDAMPLIKEAVDKDPKNKVYQNDLGLLLLDQGNMEEAISHFDAAVAADSSYDQALRNGSVAYMKLGAKMKEEAEAKSKGKGETDKSYIPKFKKAVILLEKLVSLKPDNADFLEALASAYGNAGMFKQAEAAIKKVDVLRGK
ncbi:MAG TPA: tetratricopeptide repeat protein [Bacteroidota bacterium]|jgi:tetratricopeptide (TPR) repeat protein